MGELKPFLSKMIGDGVSLSDSVGVIIIGYLARVMHGDDETLVAVYEPSIDDANRIIELWGTGEPSWHDLKVVLSKCIALTNRDVGQVRMMLQKQRHQ